MFLYTLLFCRPLTLGVSRRADRSSSVVIGRHRSSSVVIGRHRSSSVVIGRPRRQLGPECRGATRDDISRAGRRRQFDAPSIVNHITY